jgi:hypothetical protein
MTRKSSKAPSVVERLLEQQRQYQDWLEKLEEEAAGAAPTHVARRVHADYAARLDEVTKELGEHEDGVRAALAEAEARSEGLTKQHTDRTDELSEARLRRQVGEFDEEQYEEIAARCKSALTDLSKELATVERDIDRYEEILTLIRGVPEKKAASVFEAPPPPEPPPPAPPAPEPRAQPAEPARARVSQPQMQVDELAFLRSLTGGAAKGEPPRVEPARPEPPRPEVVKAEEPPAPEPRRPERPQPPAAESKDRRLPEGRESEGGTKTLVCTECGTKNLPSEWYCEKCGAELAPY